MNPIKAASFSRLSIRQRLPLLICSLLLTVILSFGIISYLGVRKAALKVGQERLRTLSHQLSGMLSTSAHNVIALAYTQANKPAVKTFLKSAGKDSAAEINTLFKELLKDSTYVQVQLLNSERKIMLSSSKAELPQDLPFNEIMFPISSKPDSGKLGNINAVGKSVYYPVTASVISENKTIGYLIRWRKMQARSRSIDQLTQLIGTEAKLYVGNADGSLWTDMVTPVPAPPESKEKKNPIFEYNRSGKEVLASMNRIANSQWLVCVEFPKSKILQTANNYIYWLLIAGSTLLIIGIFCGWLIGRNLSDPLVKLTAATSQIAAGNYPSQVLVNRMDEVGKLARAFNAMAVQVQNSQKELEEKANSYKLLFEKNPMPMWIMSTTALNILDVNEAAVNHYGYTKEEFLKLNATALRPEEDISKFMGTIPTQLKGRKRHGIWRHKKKNGTVIMVDVVTDDTIYKNEAATLTLAEDVTERLVAEAELVRSRVMQQELITETTILAQEKEREEIGKELHDNINQILASTKLYLELARSGNKDLLSSAIEKSYENINLAMGEIRSLSKQLVRPAFDTSLKDALKDLTDEIHAITPINIAFDATGFNESQVDENIKVMIYRIIQEQMNNILKYAAASEVRVIINTNYKSVRFSIQDNGVGFDMDKKSKGIGLRNIDNRVKFHKGVLDIQSSPGQGCTIDIEVPLKHEIVLYS
ncbi:MAG TPA: PAS domain S-box protein [Flavisolibacter sp.]|nr:PAS domain S-box protein [Flavisolibacter sp.]